MRKIKRPDWKILTGECPMDSCYVSPYHIEELDKWFDNYLKDRWIVDESEMIEVYSCNKFLNGESIWEHGEYADLKYKAYLVGIEKIKQETCADVLRELESKIHRSKIGRQDATYECGFNNSNSKEIWDICERAKAALKRESE